MKTTAKEVRQLICNECGLEIYACKECGNFFKDGDVVFCNSNCLDRHTCESCGEKI